MHTKNKGKPRKNNKTQAYSTPRAEAQAGPPKAEAQAGPGRIIGLEINIRLDLISNVCINIPDREGDI